MEFLLGDKWDFTHEKNIGKDVVIAGLRIQLFPVESMPDVRKEIGQEEEQKPHAKRTPVWIEVVSALQSCLLQRISGKRIFE